MSIFKTIKYQLVEQADRSVGTLELGTFSSNVLRWFEEQKILVLIDKKPTRIPAGGKFVYHIRYTRLNPEHSFFRGTKIHKDSEKELKDDRFSRGSYSQTGEYDYRGDETLYEKISFEDMCASDFIAGEYGMSIQDYIYERENNVEFAVESDSYLKEWLEKNTAPMWTYFEEVEEELNW